MGGLFLGHLLLVYGVRSSNLFSIFRIRVISGEIRSARLWLHDCFRFVKI